jgi:hypothetical protein
VLRRALPLAPSALLECAPNRLRAARLLQLYLNAVVELLERDGARVVRDADSVTGLCDALLCVMTACMARCPFVASAPAECVATLCELNISVPATTSQTAAAMSAVAAAMRAQPLERLLRAVLDVCERLQAPDSGALLTTTTTTTATSLPAELCQAYERAAVNAGIAVNLVTSAAKRGARSALRAACVDGALATLLAALRLGASARCASVERRALLIVELLDAAATLCDSFAADERVVGGLLRGDGLSVLAGVSETQRHSLVDCAVQFSSVSDDTFDELARAALSSAPASSGALESDARFVKVCARAHAIMACKLLTAIARQAVMQLLGMLSAVLNCALAPHSALFDVAREQRNGDALATVLARRVLPSLPLVLQWRQQQQQGDSARTVQQLLVLLHSVLERVQPVTAWRTALSQRGVWRTLAAFSTQHAAAVDAACGGVTLRGQLMRLTSG